MKIRVFVTGKWCAYTCRKAFREERNIFLCHLRRKGMKSVLHGYVTGLLGVFKDFCHTELHTGYVAPVLWITQNWSLAPSSSFFSLFSGNYYKYNRTTAWSHLSGENNFCPSTPILCLWAPYLPFCRLSLSYGNLYSVKTRKITIYFFLSRLKDFFTIFLVFVKSFQKRCLFLFLLVFFSFWGAVWFHASIICIVLKMESVKWQKEQKSWQKFNLDSGVHLGMEG